MEQHEQHKEERAANPTLCEDDVRGFLRAAGHVEADDEGTEQLMRRHLDNNTSDGAEQLLAVLRSLDRDGLLKPPELLQGAQALAERKRRRGSLCRSK